MITELFGENPLGRELPPVPANEQDITNLFWNITPEIIKLISGSSNVPLTADDRLALSTTEEVFNHVPAKPALDTMTRTTFETEDIAEPELVPQASDNNGPWTDYPSSIPGFIKGVAEVGLAFVPSSTLTILTVHIDFAEIIGTMTLPEDMPTSLDISMYGVLSDQYTQTHGYKNCLPNVLIRYVMKTPKEEKENAFHVFLAPASLPPEAVENRILEEDVYSTDKPPLTTILSQKPLFIYREGVDPVDKIAYKMREIIHSLGKHTIKGIDGETQVFVINKSQTIGEEEKI